MFDVTHKHKGGCTFFATVKSNGNDGHLIYLSGYGQIASALLEKYVEGQRVDNEELFAKWDKSVQKASSSVGFSISHEIEDGYIYITTFQNGIGISEEEETGLKHYIARGRRRKTKISIISPDLSEGIDIDTNHGEEIDVSEEIEEPDIDDDQ